MASLLSRLFRIARSAMPHPWEKSDRRADGRGNRQTDFYGGDRNAGATDSGSNSDRGQSSDGTSGVPAQVAEDLAVFDLVPPSSLDEVRKARNREVKKYHSDRFLNDSERFETSKRIMQIYNAAYDRLEVYYQKQKP